MAMPPFTGTYWFVLNTGPMGQTGKRGLRGPARRTGDTKQGALRALHNPKAKTPSSLIGNGVPTGTAQLSLALTFCVDPSATTRCPRVDEECDGA